MQALLRQGLCFKDLKADNVCVLSDNSSNALLGLIDYGYCVPSIEVTRDKRGTPCYAPPEAFNSSLETVDPTKFDIFMLGCLFTTIIFKDTPFVYEWRENRKNRKRADPCVNDRYY